MKLIGVLFIAAATLAAQPQPPPKQETGKASIEGIVQDEVTRNPIKKATVVLNGRANLTVVTGSDGHFAFRQLPAGTYFLQANAENYPTGRFTIDFGRQASVSLPAEEQTTDVKLTLRPGAAVRGRVVDEEGVALPQCSVAVSDVGSNEPGGASYVLNASQTDDKGAYRIENIPAGKYYVLARCFQSIPMPHAFVRRGPPANVPRLIYDATLYPGSPDLSGASKVRLTAGTELEGIDFQLMPSAGITIRGRLTSVQTGMNPQLTLRSQNKPRHPWFQQGAPVNRESGEFQIPNVRPGSYELIATANNGSSLYSGTARVDVGGAVPEPLEIPLAPAPQITGSVSLEGDSKMPLESMQLVLEPLDDTRIARQPPVKLQSDGSFSLSTIPGRWRLRVFGGGYVKSVSLGNQEVSPSALEIGPAPGPLKIVLSTKYVPVEPSISGLPTDADSAYGIVWDTEGSQFQQTSASRQGRSMLNLAPGHYHGCALSISQALTVLQQNPGFRKLLETDCPEFEVREGNTATVQMPFIALSEIKRLAEKLEGDDSAAP